MSETDSKDCWMSPDELHDSVSKQFVQVAQKSENHCTRLLARSALRHPLSALQQHLQLAVIFWYRGCLYNEK